MNAVLVFLTVVLSFAACGGSATPLKHENLMDRTLAGKSRCAAARGQDRPFVVEWDSTDLNEFEAKAKRDLVFVKYEGCEMTVLQGCSDEGQGGRYGAYNPIVNTSGSVEGFDVENETELYARLPLGAAQLQSRVVSGDKLHLKYFVSGTATSTRDVVYASDIADNPRCKPATHFVAGYSLGAFELDTHRNDKVQGGVQVLGAGAGAKQDGSTRTLKRAGDIAACTKENLIETRACRVPIRLSLRPIEPGARAGGGAAPPGASAPPPASAPIDAAALRASAAQKSQLGDGIGCLADLDRAAQADPPGDKQAELTRAVCEMRGGKCDIGKKRYREGMRAQMPTAGDVMIEQFVSTAAATNCTSGTSSPDDMALKANQAVMKAQYDKDYATCIASGHQLVLALRKASATSRTMFQMTIQKAARECAIPAGRCADARTLIAGYAELQGVAPAGRDPYVSAQLPQCR